MSEWKDEDIKVIFVSLLTRLRDGRPIPVVTMSEVQSAVAVGRPLVVRDKAALIALVVRSLPLTYMSFRREGSTHECFFLDNFHFSDLHCAVTHISAFLNAGRRALDADRFEKLMLLCQTPREKAIARIAVLTACSTGSLRQIDTVCAATATKYATENVDVLLGKHEGGPGRTAICTKYPEAMSALRDLYVSLGSLTDRRLRTEIEYVPAHVSFAAASEFLSQQFNVDVSDSTWRRLHVPPHSARASASSYQSVLSAKLAMPVRNEMPFSENEKFAAAQCAFWKIFFYSLGSSARIVCEDDRTNIPTNANPTARLLRVRSFVGEDGCVTPVSLPCHDFHSTVNESLVLSGFLILDTDTPVNQKRAAKGEPLSLNGGKACYTLKAHAYHPSTPLQHVDEWLHMLSENVGRFTDKNGELIRSLCKICDGGGDHNPSAPSSKLAQALMFDLLSLDTLVVMTYQGGGSKQQPGERPHSQWVRVLSQGVVPFEQNNGGLEASIRHLAERAKKSRMTFSGIPVDTYPWDEVPQHTFLYLDNNFRILGGTNKAKRERILDTHPVVNERLRTLMKKFGIELGSHMKLTFRQYLGLSATYNISGRYISVWHIGFDKDKTSSRKEKPDRDVRWGSRQEVPTPLPGKDGHYLGNADLMYWFSGPLSLHPWVRFKRTLEESVQTLVPKPPDAPAELARGALDFLLPSNLIGVHAPFLLDVLKSLPESDRAVARRRREVQIPAIAKQKLESLSRLTCWSTSELMYITVLIADKSDLKLKRSALLARHTEDFEAITKHHKLTMAKHVNDVDALSIFDNTPLPAKTREACEKGLGDLQTLQGDSRRACLVEFLKAGAKLTKQRNLEQPGYI